MTTTTASSRLVPLVRKGSRPSAVLLPGAGGGLGYYLKLAGFLGKTRNVYGIRASGLVAGEGTENRVPDMVDSVVQVLDNAGVEPDLVLGWSMGGVIGWETSRRLAERGVEPSLVMLDTSPFSFAAGDGFADWLLDKIGGMLGPRPDEEAAARVKRVLEGQLTALSDNKVEREYAGRVLYFACAEPEDVREQNLAAWRQLAPDFSAHQVDVDHYSIAKPENFPALREPLAAFLTT